MHEEAPDFCLNYENGYVNRPPMIVAKFERNQDSHKFSKDNFRPPNFSKIQGDRNYPDKIFLLSSNPTLPLDKSIDNSVPSSFPK